MIAGVVKDLVAPVRDTTFAAPKVAGTIYVAIRLELDGDADDGLFWDTDAGGDWVAGGSVAAWPEATYTAAGLWVYQLPSAATTGKTAADKPGRITWRMTDNVATPANETAASVPAEEPIHAADAFNPASDSTEVRAFTTAGKAEIQQEAEDALAAFGAATAAGVSGLNNLSAAQVNAEVDQALADVGLTTTVTGRIDAAVSTRLASAGYTAPPSAATVAAAVLGYVTSGSRTLQEVVALIEALVGVRTGVSSSPGSVVMKNPEGDKTRATVTSDGAGNVSAVTIGDLTP